MEQLTVQNDLRARSKSALVRGILAMALPNAAVLIGYIAFLLIAILGVIRNDGDERAMLVPLFVGMIVFFVFLLAAGLVMLILGNAAWKKARQVGLDARSLGVRRPPMSVVAHVFGLVSFISGIAVVVLMGIYLVLALGFGGVILGLVNAA